MIVFLSANRYDFNNFHLHGNNRIPNTLTYGKTDSWFQIEFDKGSVIITGFRYKSPIIDKFHEYKIMAIDDVTMDSRPIKVLRFMLTKPNELRFYYFDIFRFYFQ